MSTPAYAYNVKNPAFGARGAGLIDEGSYVRAAVAACAAAGGGAVYLPAGIYLIGKDGANPWGINLANTNVRIIGSGKSTILKQYGSAGGGAFDLIRITDGAVCSEFEGITFSQAGLTSPSTDCHLINAEEAEVVKVINCYFEGGVASAGSYVKLGGVTGLICEEVWLDGCEMRDSYGPLVEIGSNTKIVWVQHCPALINTTYNKTIVIDDALTEGISDIKIVNCKIQNSTGWAIYGSEVGDRLQIQGNTQILGLVSVAGANIAQVQNNQITLTAASLSDAVVTFSDGIDIQFQDNIVTREVTCDDGLLVELDTVERFQDHGNNWNQATEAGLVYGLDCTGVQCGTCVTKATNPGTHTNDAYKFEAASVALENIQSVGLQITAAAGSWANAFTVVSSGATIGAVLIAPGIFANCDNGVLFDEGGGGASIFTERADGLMCAGGLIVATTSAWSITVSGVAIHIGLNASKFGPCHIAGNGTPEGVYVKRPGSLYTQLDGAPGSILWVKELNNTAAGWDNK